MNGAVRAVRAMSLVVAASLASVAVALAQGTDGATTARLSWARGVGAESCPDRVALEKDVSARLGRDAFAEPARRSIEGTVAKEGSKWIAKLYIRQLDGTLIGSRDLNSEAPDCKPLGSAVALSIALAIDPEATFTAAGSVSASGVASVAASSAKKPPRAASSALPPPIVVYLPMRDREAGTLVSVRGMLATGLLPGTTPGLALAVDPERFRSIHPTFGFLAMPSARVADGSAAFGLYAGWAGACLRLAGETRLSLSICGEVLFGAMYAIVFNSIEPINPGERFWMAAAPSGRIALRVVGPLVAELGVEGVIPFWRKQFTVQNRPDPLVFTPPVAALVAWLGLGVHFQ